MAGKTLPIGRQELPKDAKGRHGRHPARSAKIIILQLLRKTAPHGTLLAMT
jgi:hypothetical protein